MQHPLDMVGKVCAYK